MQTLKSLLAGLVLFLPASSAQITSRGSASVTGLLTDILGINLSDPYVVLGFSATFGLMWVSVYIIFKVGISKIDSGYGGRRSNPIGDALGLTDDSRNLLAVLTLLITLSMLGTGAFYGMIRGWQSLILLTFSFMLLAGLLFVLIGGTGGIIGGTAYVTGKSAKFASEGVKELKDELDSLRSEGESLDELEDEIEDEERDARRREEKDRGSGDSSPGDDSGSSGRDNERKGGEGSKDSSEGRGEDDSESGRTEAEVRDIVRKLEKAFKILEDIEGKLSEDFSRESERIDRRINQLEELQKILESDKSPYRDLRNLIEDLRRQGIDSSSSEDELEKALGDRDISDLISRSEHQRYISELGDLEENLQELKAEIAILREIEELLSNLQDEVGEAEKEEEILEELIRNLGNSEVREKLVERLDRDKEELEEEREREVGMLKEEKETWKQTKQEALSARSEALDEVESVHADFSEDVVEYVQERAEEVDELTRTLGALENMAGEYNERGIVNDEDLRGDFNLGQNGLIEDVEDAATSLAGRALENIAYLEDAVEDYANVAEAMPDLLDEMDDRAGSRIDELRSEYDQLGVEVEDVEDEYGVEALRNRVKQHIEGATGEDYDSLDTFRRQIRAEAENPV
ncbi:MAG: hypothetical protein ABEK10_02590 [Candidatus Nanosalina sp.]